MNSVDSSQTKERDEKSDTEIGSKIKIETDIDIEFSINIKAERSGMEFGCNGYVG